MGKEVGQCRKSIEGNFLDYMRRRNAQERILHGPGVPTYVCIYVNVHEKH